MNLKLIYIWFAGLRFDHYDNENIHKNVPDGLPIYDMYISVSVSSIESWSYHIPR